MLHRHSHPHIYSKVYICTWFWPEYTFRKWKWENARIFYTVAFTSSIGILLTLESIILFGQSNVYLVRWENNNVICAGRHCQYSVWYLSILSSSSSASYKKELFSIDCIRIPMKLVIVCKFTRHQIEANILRFLVCWHSIASGDIIFIMNI